ncbi:MAG: hypothetical protein A2097_04205 [Desulfobacula sp. GWF2_41_7]|nr:MAG: hypothetical protein A2097_04205 [Desulfobacula sp. GWF2_41_7]
MLDFAGPFEVFTTASRVKSRQTKNTQPFFNVFTIGEKKEVIRARGGLSIIPEYGVNGHPAIDLLIIPGGVVTAAGISAGIDMSLYLVSRLADSKLALDTARQMEYNWKQNP